MRFFRLVPALALPLLLAACASAPVQPASQPGAAERTALTLSGRLMVHYQKDGNPESVSGNFTWVQQGQQVDVSLASPFGDTIATIHVTPQAATLVMAKQAPRTAPDVDSLSREALGWPLPVAGLRDWMQGVAIAQDGSRFVASPAHDTVLTQDGWRLRFVAWQDGAVPLPKRIDAERVTAVAAEELSIRIVIDQREQP